MSVPTIEMPDRWPGISSPGALRAGAVRDRKRGRASRLVPALIALTVCAEARRGPAVLLCYASRSAAVTGSLAARIAGEVPPMRPMMRA